MTTETRATIARLITGQPMRVGMNQYADQVLAAMRRRDVRFAAVEQGGRITAVLDRLSLSDRVAGRTGLLVRDVVHPGLPCLRSDSTAEAAARLMRVTGSAAVPVVDEHHRFIGLVTAEALAAAPD